MGTTLRGIRRHRNCSIISPPGPTRIPVQPYPSCAKRGAVPDVPCTRGKGAAVPFRHVRPMISAIPHARRASYIDEYDARGLFLRLNKQVSHARRSQCDDSRCSRICVRCGNEGRNGFTRSESKDEEVRDAVLLLDTCSISEQQEGDQNVFEHKYRWRTETQCASGCRISSL